MKGLNKMEFLFVFIGGLIIGGGAVFGLSKNKKNQEPIVIQSHQGTEEAIKNLTALDITQPICEPQYIKDNGDSLCRELTCLQFSRGLDSKTSGQQCEAISNINNKIQIEKWCNKYEEQELKKECIELFWKRN